MNIYQHVACPDPDSLSPEVRERLDEYETLRQSVRDADYQLREVTFSRQAAEDADAQASATAIRAKKELPKQVHLQEHLADKQAAEHGKRSADAALEMSWKDLTAAVEEERSVLLQAGEESVEDALQDYTAAVDALASAHTRMEQAERQNAWARNFPEGASRDRSPQRLRYPVVSGSQTTFDRVLEGLRGAVVQPKKVVQATAANGSAESGTHKVSVK